MPRHSKAFLTCQKTLLRSLGLVDLYTRLSKEDVKELGLIPEQAHVTDLIRSSVVLTVSAMDAYFTNRFTEMLVPYIKRRGPTRAMVKLLHSAGLNAEQALIMAAMDRPYRRVRTLMQRHLERYVTQKFTAVDELFSSFGINDLCKHVEARCGRKRLLRSVELLVQRRHEIVHEGDLNGRGVLQPIGALEVVRRTRHLMAFVSCADDMLNGLLASRRRTAAA